MQDCGVSVDPDAAVEAVLQDTALGAPTHTSPDRGSDADTDSEEVDVDTLG